MSASEGQSVAELYVKTLQLMQNDEAFDAFIRLVNCFHEQMGTSDPTLPRKRKAPSRFEVGEGEKSYNDISIKDHYRRLYFEVLDLAVTWISQWFNQPGYSVYKNLENLLQPTTNHLMNNFVHLVSMVIILPLVNSLLSYRFWGPVLQSIVSQCLCVIAFKHYTKCQPHRKNCLVNCANWRD